MRVTCKDLDGFYSFHVWFLSKWTMILWLLLFCLDVWSGKESACLSSFEIQKSILFSHKILIFFINFNSKECRITSKIDHRWWEPRTFSWPKFAPKSIKQKRVNIIWCLTYVTSKYEDLWTTLYMQLIRYYLESINIETYWTTFNFLHFLYNLPKKIKLNS